MIFWSVPYLAPSCEPLPSPPHPPASSPGRSVLATRTPCHATTQPTKGDNNQTKRALRSENTDIPKTYKSMSKSKWISAGNP
jgi:hypothetical protein